MVGCKGVWLVLSSISTGALTFAEVCEHGRKSDDDYRPLLKALDYAQ